MKSDLSVQQLSAVILENEDEIGGEIDLCTTLQKETFRDVEISSDLSESQRQEVLPLAAGDAIRYDCLAFKPLLSATTAVVVVSFFHS